jgi:hypothetical protein
MENRLCAERNVLFAPLLPESAAEMQFCGTVVRSAAAWNALTFSGPRLAYMTGAADEVAALIAACSDRDVHFRVVRELVDGVLVTSERAEWVSRGQIPLFAIGRQAVFIRDCFQGADFFQRVTREHAFQELTESNKPSLALRTGIYLSHVTQVDQRSLAFHLLRCSTNLRGPTENFARTDREIVDQTNALLPFFFAERTAVNHVLAQVYHNRAEPADGGGKETKAKISRHSDKTKDMAASGVLAFATFYDWGSLPNKRNSPTDAFDVCHRGGTSVFTQIDWQLKDAASHPNLVRQCRIKMYANSLLIVGLDTNRLFTHEIKPSTLHVADIPVRLGYVMRCSKTLAVHRDGRTFIVDEHGQHLELASITPESAHTIKTLYRDENITEQRVQYPLILTSLNEGDFLPPTLHPEVLPPTPEAAPLAASRSD